MTRRKIHFNVWRDPQPKTDPHYLSPHCARGACQWCRKRRAQAKAALLARLRPPYADMFSHWETKLPPGTRADLGPSAPDARIQSYVLRG